ncbi:MAG: ribbon-helix-helix protein, CopG family [Candidatus Firestonebacteria bacterium]
MTTQMIIRIDSNTKDRLNRLAMTEGKTRSKMLRELIENYINERDISTYIDNIWEKIGKKLQSQGAKVTDIDFAIKEVRKKRHASSN